MDIEKRTISVTKQVNVVKGGLQINPPKTQNSVRTIVIPQKTVELLIEEHEKHPESPYMFPSPVTGDMYNPDAVGRIHKKLFKRAGIQDIRFHDLRHPYVKHTTKNISLQKQKSQTTNRFDSLGFLFFDLCRAVVLKMPVNGWHFY